VDQLAKQAAEMALRLAALPADRLRHDLEAFNFIEPLAMRILTGVSAVRTGKDRSVGEIRGSWAVIEASQCQ
jgi:hypothetical protein